MDVRRKKDILKRRIARLSHKNNILTLEHKKLLAKLQKELSSLKLQKNPIKVWFIKLWK